MPAGTHLWMISEHYDKGSRSDLRMSEMSLSVADEDNLSDWERKEGSEEGQESGQESEQQKRPMGVASQSNTQKENKTKAISRY